MSAPVRAVFKVPVADPNDTAAPALSVMVCGGSKVTVHSSLQAILLFYILIHRKNAKEEPETKKKKKKKKKKKSRKDV
jgi:hypothetical protein